jgi:hypothetical protein
VEAKAHVGLSRQMMMMMMSHGDQYPGRDTKRDSLGKTHPVMPLHFKKYS